MLFLHEITDYKYIDFDNNKNILKNIENQCLLSSAWDVNIEK